MGKPTVNSSSSARLCEPASIAATTEGEPASEYGSFFNTTVGPLRRYLARFFHSEADAEDIAQDAYLKVFHAMKERPIDYPRALLYATARHLALDELKHRSRSPFLATPSHEDVPSGAGVPALVMAREDWKHLEWAIAALPEDCRSVFLLRMVEQLPHGEIAERLGVSRRLVEKRYYRAMSLLFEARREQSERDS